MYRLDRIRSVKRMEPPQGPEKLDYAGERFAEYLWGTSAGEDRDRTVRHLEMRVRAGKEEQFIADRLMREKRNGTVERLNEDTWLFAVDVYDALEILPWIRTFTGRIESLTCSDAEVTKRFYEDLDKMYSMYGGEDGDI